MSYLVDTNHWRYLSDDVPSVVRRINRAVREDSLYVSVVTEAELLVSVEGAASPQVRRMLTQHVQEVLQLVVEVLPVTSEIAANFARISVELRRKGRPIGVNDMWLAATAQTHRLTLVTNDADFSNIDDLSVENWLESDTQTT